MTVVRAVEAYINARPFLEEALTDGIINYSGLARNILPELRNILGQHVKEGAIVMALKRRSPNYYYQVSAGIRGFLGRLGDFTIRSNISDYTYLNSPTLMRQQGQLLAYVAHHPELFCSFSQGLHESTIVSSSVMSDQMKQYFEKEELIAHQSNLASITTLLPKENTEISGIYYFIFKQLAWSDINIVEVISTTNEFTVVVDESDVEQAFSLLRGLTRSADF